MQRHDYGRAFFLFYGKYMSPETEEKHLANVLRHIENVRDDCQLLGQRLIEQGKDDLGRLLIANGLIHDNSKLSGIEWEYLHPEIKESNPTKFFEAHRLHVTTNPHHPEFYKRGIRQMPEEYIAEMVCDWHSRSSEFGTDLWDWIKTTAVVKYSVSVRTQAFKKIKYFVGLLLDRRFT